MAFDLQESGYGGAAAALSEKMLVPLEGRMLMVGWSGVADAVVIRIRMMLAILRKI